MKTTFVFVAVALALVASAHATVYFKETFGDDSWSDRWVESTEWKSSAEMGKWTRTAGKWYADESDTGLQTSQDAKFYGLSADLDTPFDNEEKDLILSYTVKMENKIDCGGAYIKLLPEGVDKTSFGGDAPYAIMFGPDVCGTGTRKTHAIFGYNGENYLINKDVRCETDQLSHLYTFIIHPDNTYDIQIDQKSVQSGSLYDDWDMLGAKKIKDPSVSKPEDWVDEEMIPDPDATKPEGWDDIPEYIPDEAAEMPDDWDEEEDGDWEPPLVSNPEYQGEWSAPMIKNPDYEGPWVHPEIDNPDYVYDAALSHRCNPCAAIGFELWQVKSGTIFDDIIVTDSLEEAEEFAEETWLARKTDEKAMYDQIQEEKRAAEEEARKKAEEEAAAAEAEAEDEEDEDEDDYDEDEDDETESEL